MDRRFPPLVRISLDVVNDFLQPRSIIQTAYCSVNALVSGIPKIQNLRFNFPYCLKRCHFIQEFVFVWTDESDYWSWGQTLGVPRWIRLERVGNIFKTYHGTNGTSWTLFRTETVSMSSTTYVGIAVAATNQTSSAQVFFSGLTLNGQQGGSGNTPPIASFTATPSSGEAPLAVTFDGSGLRTQMVRLSTLTGYSWNFGDGATGSGVTVNHTYNGSGNYTVILTVTDNDGATDADSKVISVSGGGGSCVGSGQYTVTVQNGYISGIGNPKRTDHGAIGETCFKHNTAWERWWFTANNPINVYWSSTTGHVPSEGTDWDDVEISVQAGVAPLTNMFAGTSSAIAKTDLVAEIPDELTLDQNYPNPFNPLTRIRFGLPDRGDVRIRVFNVLGIQVAELTDRQYDAGWHSLVFNAHS